MQELQLNVFDTQALRTAQIHPERYGNLVVRVAGPSARFFGLSPVKQQVLIERAWAYA
jgi:pyruvate-formate lyase